MASYRFVSKSIVMLFFASGLTIATACNTSTNDVRDGSRVDVTDLTYRLLPGGARILTGTLHNRSGSLISSAQIQISLFDADNRRISTLPILIQDIPAGNSKSFREPVRGELDVRGARVRSVVIL